MTRSTISGVMRYDLLARHHFSTLTNAEQAQAIHRLAATGAGDHTIAQVTGLSVEFVRRVLGKAQL